VFALCIVLLEIVDVKMQVSIKQNRSCQI